MSTDVTMQELELETAELLPARETLTAATAATRAAASPRCNYGIGNANQNGRLPSSVSRSSTATAAATSHRL